MNEIIYQMRGDAVVITDGMGSDRVLNLESLNIAIANIRRNAYAYATHQAYLKHLETYVEARSYLLRMVGAR